MRKATLLTAIVFLLTSCTDIPEQFTPLSDLYIEQDVAKASDYLIGLGDELEIKFFTATEMNERVVVRPDGKISLNLIQDIKAAGLTPKQLAKQLRQRLADKVKQPDLVVILRAMNSQKAFVGGEVAKAGAVQLAGSETLLQVLNMAGWVTPDASSETIILMRQPEPDTPPKLYLIDFEKLSSGEDLLQNVKIRPGDTILVPPSGVTSANRWVAKYLKQMVPFTGTAGAYYNVNPSGR